MLRPTQQGMSERAKRTHAEKSETRPWKHAANTRAKNRETRQDDDDDDASSQKRTLWDRKKKRRKNWTRVGIRRYQAKATRVGIQAGNDARLKQEKEKKKIETGTARRNKKETMDRNKAAGCREERKPGGF